MKELDNLLEELGLDIDLEEEVLKESKKTDKEKEDKISLSSLYESVVENNDLEDVEKFEESIKEEIDKLFEEL